jgi:CRP-like cAMP-binding protein
MNLQHVSTTINRPPRTVPERWHRHPWIARLGRYIELGRDDVASLWRLIDTELTVKKRRDLVVDGYSYRKLCFVEDGFAARYKLLRNGKRQIVNFVYPGDVIGLPASFLEKARYSVVALTDIKVQICSIDTFVQLAYRQPQFALALSWLAVHELVTCAEHTINTGRRNPPERLAHLLLEICSRLTLLGRAADGSFDLPFSQEAMSDALGLSVPHLNRTLAKLRADGLLKIDGHSVELTDRQALELLGQYQSPDLTRVPLARNTECVA